MKKYLLLWTLLTLCCSIFAQSPTLYSTGQGLISTRINQIRFDQKNFLWISTDQGLCRFDGKSFTTFQRQKGNPNALQENHVTEIYVNSQGQHWIGAADGLYYFCEEKNQMTLYLLNKSIPSICISEIITHPTRPNAIIIGTYGFGLYVFDTDRKELIKDETLQIQSLLKRWNCQHIYADSRNHLWNASPSSIQCFDLDHKTEIQLPGIEAFGEQFIIQDMIEDRTRNRLYLATLNNSLLYCDLNTMVIQKTDIAEFEGMNLTALNMTPEGDLLIGTENSGLWKMHNNQITKLQVEECPIDLDHAKIHTIAYDDQRNIWLGLYQKGLLVIPHQKQIFHHQAVKPGGEQYNLGSISSFAYMSDGSRICGIDGEGFVHEMNDGRKKHINQQNSELETNSILSLVGLPGNIAYVGTYKYGVYIYDGQSLRKDPRLALLNKQSIMSMVHDSLTHTLYMGTNGDGIYAYQTETKQLSRISGEMHLLWVTSLGLDRKHRLWAGTEGAVHCFDVQINERIAIHHKEFLRTFGFAEDENGTIWMATDHGLRFYAAGNDSLQQAQTNGRPISEEFYSILRSKDGNLWMASNQGLVCYNPKTKTLSRYIDPEIAAVGSFSFRAAKSWPDGQLSFGGDNGILEFYPEAIGSQRLSIRPILFTRLWVNNTLTDYDPSIPQEENVLDRSLHLANNLHLPASANSFSISFALQEYSNPISIRYEYMLEGFDKGWHEVFGQDQNVSYASLPWGSYKLRVKALLPGPDGEVQTREKELDIVIDAPWHATWIAKVCYFLIFLVIVLTIFNIAKARAHERRAMRRAVQNRQIKEAKLHMYTLVSHEIKTPLTLIISPLRKLMQRNNDNATQSVYEMIYRNSLRILMLVNQQMDIKKIDNGQLKLHVSEVPIRSFLTDIMQYFSNTALIHQIDFRLIMDDNLQEAALWFDPDQMDKVFFNLLSNAFKYVNDTGQVHIKVTQSPNQKGMILAIYNSGSAIPDADSEQIFERFGADGSSGLGLSLANELTNIHHGHLSAQNEKDGVTFSVVLPYGSDHYTEEEKQPIEKTASPAQKQMDVDSRDVHEANTAPETEHQDKELIEMLNDELREKKRLRERRSNLSINYDGKEISSADEKLLNRVADCISKNLSDPDFDVDVLAKEVSISRVHLNRKLKELIDTSPSTLIKTSRLKQAAFLLVQNSATVSEVAYTVGFSSPAYFSSNFSAYFSMTPKEFINTYAGNPDDPELQRLLE